MVKFLVKFGTFIFVAVTAVFAVVQSDNYYSLIEASDLHLTTMETKDINEFFDNYESFNEILEAQLKNTQEYVVINKNNNNSGNGGGQNITVPDFKTGLEAYMFAESLYNSANGTHIETTGSIETSVGIPQEIKAKRIRDNKGNQYILNIARSTTIEVVKFGFEGYYNGRMFKTRMTGSVTPDLRATFSNNWQLTSLNAYESKYGVKPTQLYYIVNEKTVEECTNFKFENNLYTFKLKLNPSLAGEKYKYTVKANAEASEFPVYSAIELEVTIDKNGKFKKIVTRDVYRIKARGFDTQCSGTTTDTFMVIDASVNLDVPSGF